MFHEVVEGRVNLRRVGVVDHAIPGAGDLDRVRVAAQAPFDIRQQRDRDLPSLVDPGAGKLKTEYAPNVVRRVKGEKQDVG
jgi:hypothetical protein